MMLALDKKRDISIMASMGADQQSFEESIYNGRPAYCSDRHMSWGWFWEQELCCFNKILA